MDVSTTKGKLIAAGCAVGATVAGVFAYRVLTRKSRRKKNKRKVLSKEDLCQVFDSLISTITEALKRIAGQERLIRQNYKDAGKQVSIDSMYKFCQQRLEEEMAIAEPQVYDKHHTTEAAVAAAVKKFGDDLEVSQRVERFQKLALQVRKQDVAVPSHITEEVFIQLMTEMMESITKAMEDTVADVVSKGADTKSPEFNMAMATQFQPAVQAISASSMQKYGITEEIFTVAMTKFQESPTFNLALTALTNEQHARFQAIGVSND